jgi:hypothetical protein
MLHVIARLAFVKLFCLLIFSFSKLSDQTPKTFTIDGSKLLSSKLKIENGDSLFLTGYVELLAVADQVLKREPYSVTFGGTVPIDGTKNDYFTSARYWWPDSSKTDGLPYIHKDGQASPDWKGNFDSKMLGGIANDVFMLGVAYFFSGDEKYAGHAKKLIEVFFFDEKTRMSPHFEYSQVIMGRAKSGGATISSTDLTKCIEGVQLILGSSLWSSKDTERLQAWFADFLNWMLHSEKGRKQALANNNVGTYYTLQAAVYSLFIDDLELAKEIITTQGYKRISDQINDEGEMPLELRRATPWNYVKYNLTAFDKLVEVAKKVNVDLLIYKSQKGGSVQKAFEWLVPYANGEKEWEYSPEHVSPTAVKNVLARTKNVNACVGIQDSDQPVSYKLVLF